MENISPPILPVTSMTDSHAVDGGVLLLIAPQCKHCDSMLKVMTELVKQASIAQLNIVNLHASPHIAEQYGVKSVPWFNLAGLEFEGAMTKAELLQWLAYSTEEKWHAYLSKLLSQARLDKVVQYVQELEDGVKYLLQLLQQEGQELSIRVGISAVMEDLVGTQLLSDNLNYFLNLARHPKASIRADGAYFLGLSRNPSAKVMLQAMLQDENKSVQEIAHESIEEISQFSK